MDALLKVIADGTLLVILAISGVVILYAIRKNFWTYAPVIIMAALASLLVGKIMSLLYQPAVARPFLELGLQPGAAYIDNPGFPSDHALLATVAVVAVYAVTRNRWLTTVLSLFIVMMCVGRVAALVHTPADVIFGVIAGLSGLVWYKKIDKIA